MAYREYPQANRGMTQAFAGINDHEHISDGQWQDVLNMTCDEYPAAKTREKRKIVKMTGTATMSGGSTLVSVTEGGITTSYLKTPISDASALPAPPFAVKIDGNLYFVTEIMTGPYLRIEPGSNDVYTAVNAAYTAGKTGLTVYSFLLNGSATDAMAMDDKMVIATDAGWLHCGNKALELGGQIKKMAAMGRQIFTNNGYLTDIDLENKKGVLLNLFFEDSKITITPCNEESITKTIATTQPGTPSDGDYYYNITTNGLYRYSATQNDWISMAAPYTKMVIDKSCTTDVSELRAGDGVKYIYGEDTATSVIAVLPQVAASGNDAGSDGYIVLNAVHIRRGMLSVRIIRRMPVLDFVCEHNNRIWGCRYGKNDEDEFVNEIYASALGDPLNWFLFEGTAADSYVTSVGYPGQWTGCCECGKYVLFFKADRVFVVSGTEPSNFNYETIDDYGVQPGSERSLSVIDNRAYYKSEHGIMVIGTDAYPRCISRELGYDVWTNAIAGNDGRKYYISMQKGELRCTYVYDVEQGVWTRETDPVEGLAVFCRYKNNLIAVSSVREYFVSDLRLTYSEAKSAAVKAAVPLATWIERFYMTQIRIAWDLAQLKAESNESTIPDIIDYYEGKSDITTPADCKLFVDVECVERAAVIYTYVSNEKTTNMVLPGEALTSETEKDFCWFAETGRLGLNDPDEKCIRVIQIRVKSGAEAALKIKAKYDGDEDWSELRAENRGKTGTYRIAYSPVKRCDSYKLRFEGTGDTVIYSITIQQEDRGNNV